MDSFDERRYRRRMLEAIVRDTRHAARALAARPAYSVLSTATLALVIGAATAVIAVVDATMFRPLPFPAGDRIVKLFTMPPGTSAVTERNPLHPRTFYRFRTREWQSIGRVEGIWARERALGVGNEPESVSGGAVSAGLLAMFGAGPLIGRTFTDEEDWANARVVVLSHALWQRRFGGDPGVLGQSVAIDREPHLVISVMPQGFSSGYVDAEIWTPLNITERTLDGNATFVQTFARLEAAATLKQLASELRPALDAVIPEAPTMLQGWRPDAAMIRDAQFGQQRPNLFALVAAVLALAAITCANLANLTLAHVLSRRSEHALRAALGGGRAAIVRLQLLETFLLLSGGTAAGIVLGAWTLPLLLALDPTTARFLGDVTLDWRVQVLTMRSHRRWPCSLVSFRCCARCAATWRETWPKRLAARRDRDVIIGCGRGCWRPRPPSPLCSW